MLSKINTTQNTERHSIAHYNITILLHTTKQLLRCPHNYEPFYYITTGIIQPILTVLAATH